MHACIHTKLIYYVCAICVQYFKFVIICCVYRYLKISYGRYISTIFSLRDIYIYV
jgi:hypothetical protein